MRWLAALLIFGAASAERASSPGELDLLISTVLQRASSTDGSLIDSDLLGPRPWLIREEIEGTEFKIPPVLNGPVWLPKSAAALQGIAEIEKRIVHFAAIRDINISGNVARLWVGVTVAVPKPPPGHVALIVCCAEARDEYRKGQGRWRFSKRLGVLYH